MLLPGFLEELEKAHFLGLDAFVWWRGLGLGFCRGPRGAIFGSPRRSGREVVGVVVARAETDGLVDGVRVAAPPDGEKHGLIAVWVW